MQTPAIAAATVAMRPGRARRPSTSATMASGTPVVKPPPGTTSQVRTTPGMASSASTSATFAWVAATGWVRSRSSVARVAGADMWSLRVRGLRTLTTLRSAARPHIGTSAGPLSALVLRVRGAQVREHGEDPAVLVLALAQPELHEDVADVALHGAVGEPQALRDPGVGQPLGHQRQHLALARGELGQRVLDEAGHHLRVERGPAPGDPAGRVEEVVHGEHAVLEQVAEPALRDQRHGVLGLEVLGEQQDADLRSLLADPPRRARALVGERRRHADVDDRDVGGVLLDGPEQRVAVPHVGDDLLAGVREQPGEARPQEDLVLGEDYAHGSSAATVVPAPGGLVTR